MTIINEELAKAAKQAISFNEYVYGTAMAEYQELVDKAENIVSARIKKLDTLDKQKLCEALEAYKKALAEQINGTNSRQAKSPSYMITGAGGRNPEQHLKKKRELQAFIIRSSEKTEYWRRKLSSIGNHGILLRDENIIEKLETEAEHQTGATKKATLDKINEIKTLKEAGVIHENVTILGHDAIKFIDPNKMRIGFEFDGKPAPEVIKALKSKSFRYVPSVKRWQRLLTINGKYAVDDLTD